MRTISLFGVLSCVLASLPAQAEDTLFRPQVIGFTRGLHDWIAWLDRNGDFAFAPPPAELVFLASSAATSQLRGRDGEPCTTLEGRNVFCDRNGNGRWDGNAGGDLASSFGVTVPGEIFYHDVDGDGTRQLVKLATLWPFDGEFRVDANQNDRWDGPAGGDAIHIVAPGTTSFTPLVCDHDGDGDAELGKVLQDGSTLAIDLDGDGAWSGPGGGDRLVAFGSAAGPALAFLCADLDGQPGDEIVKYVGDVDGRDRFMIDANRNLRWDGSAGGDQWLLLAPQAGPGSPFAIDPEGDGTSVLGKYAWGDPGETGGDVVIDLDGDRVWRGNAGGDFATHYGPLLRWPLVVYDKPAP